MTIENGEVADPFEFELPIIASNVLVTKVDTANGKIFFGGGTGYEVGDVYDGNLGTLVGRTVNVGVNSDREIEKLSVRKADVVYGVMKYYNKGDKAAVYDVDGNIVTPFSYSDKSYLEDQTTKTKYYMTSSGTTTINPSRTIEVVSGNYEPLTDKKIYEYTKLVLNSNGTVACAVVDPSLWFDAVKVADVDGTIVDETSKTSVDLKDYTIEKDGEYVTTADLEEDDIIFYNVNADGVEKFAEVYTVTVTGEPSDIDSTSLKIDGTAYKWNSDVYTIVPAKYYNADDDVYTDLLDPDNIAGQKVLNNFDPELGVIAYLDRLGNIAYIDGIDKEEAETTDTWYVTTSDGAGYSQALGSFLKFTVSDGTEETIEIPVSQLTSLNGVKGSIKHLKAGDDDPFNDGKVVGGAGATAADNNTDGATYAFSFVPKNDEDAAEGFANIPAGAAGGACLVETGVLVKVTRDEDNKIIGLTFPGFDDADLDAYDWATTIDGKNTNSLTATAAKVETKGNSKAELVASTNIWTYTTDSKGNVSVTKTAFEDFEKTTFPLDNANSAATNDDGTGFGPFVLLKGSSVTDVLLRETTDANGVSDTFKDGDTETTEGIITGYTQKLNKDKDGNYVNTITVKTISGVDVTYDTLDESIVGNPGKNMYAEIELDKATGKIAGVTPAWDAAAPVTIHAIANTSTSTEIHADNDTVIKLAPESLVLKWTGSKYTAMKLNQIAASTKDLVVVWHDEYFNADEKRATDGGTGVHYADFVVVEETNIIPAATVTLSSLAGKKVIAANAQIGTVTENDLAAAYTLKSSSDGITGWTTVPAVGLNVATDGKLTVDAAWSLHDEYYAVFVTSSDLTAYDDAESDVVKADDAVLDLNNIPATTISRTTSTSGEATTGTSAFAFVDQYGDAITITALTNKTLDAVSGNTGNATGTLSVTEDGVANVTMSNGDTAGTEALKYVDDDNGLTWTVSGTAGTAGSAEVAWTISVAKTL